MSPKADVNETMQMYAHYQKGLSCAEVGKIYHYDPQTVWRRFKIHGLKTRRPGSYKKEQS